MVRPKVKVINYREVAPGIFMHGSGAVIPGEITFMIHIMPYNLDDYRNVINQHVHKAFSIPSNMLSL
jgi:hypothetical protein